MAINLDGFNGNNNRTNISVQQPNNTLKGLVGASIALTLTLTLSISLTQNNEMHNNTTITVQQNENKPIVNKK